MSDPEPPKRRFWRFHLSTAVFMTILAGIFLGLNTRQSHCKVDMKYAGQFNAFVSGWPFKHLVEFTDLGSDDSEQPIYRSDDLEKHGNLILNIVIGIVGVALSGVFCEWLIRRREARRS